MFPQRLKPPKLIRSSNRVAYRTVGFCAARRVDGSFYGAIDFGILSGGNLPSVSSESKHEQEDAATRSRSSGIVKKLPAHVRRQEIQMGHAWAHGTIPQTTQVPGTHAANYGTRATSSRRRRTSTRPFRKDPATFTNSASGANNFPNASMSWWFQAVANPSTTFRTASVSLGAARTQVAEKDVSRPTTANDRHSFVMGLYLDLAKHSAVYARI